MHAQKQSGILHTQKQSSHARKAIGAWSCMHKSNRGAVLHAGHSQKAIGSGYACTTAIGKRFCLLKAIEGMLKSNRGAVTHAQKHLGAVLHTQKAIGACSKAISGYACTKAIGKILHTLGVCSKQSGSGYACTKAIRHRSCRLKAKGVCSKAIEG